MANVGYATLQIIPSVRGIGNELRRQLVAPAGDAGNDAGEAAGGGFTDAFAGAMAAIGVTEIASSIGSQFTEAFGSALEQGNVQSTLSAQLGSSGKVAANQGAAVGKLFADGVTQNFEQGAEAIRSIVSGGLVPPGATVKQLDVIGTKMVDVANVFGADMSMQTQAVSAMLKNKLAPDAETALDIITVGFQKLGPNAEDILETFQEYSVQLRKLGLDADTSLGLFQQGLQGGARDTDIIADAFKEFSIRAIDMSQSSQDAYKAIGLNAGKMSLQIAKGGKGASDGLQTVLDRLRLIKDPVKQNAAAVGLFGTQAEDLGAALFKLDPGKAATSFSSVTGAADQLGKTIRSGPSYEIEHFKRTLQQGLVNFMGGEVLPVVTKVAHGFNTYLLPPIGAVSSIVAGVLVPTLLILGSVLLGTVNWLREWGIWLAPLAILIGGVTIALNAQAIATALVTAVFSAYRAAIVVGTAVTGGFAAAQGVLNAVMALNPITLIVIALIALGAALFIAWKKSDTFRAIVMGAWAGIKSAAVSTWTGFIKPALDGFMVGLRAVGSAASWLWTTVLSPVFSFIGLAARILLTVMVVGVLLPIVAAAKLLGDQFVWLWGFAIEPVIGWIVAGAVWLWGAVKVQFGYFTEGIHTLGAVGLWLWRNAFSPVIGWIVGGAKWLWSGVKIQFGYFTTGLRALGNAGTWLWRNAISPAFHGIGDLAVWLYNKGIKPPIDSAKEAARLLGVAFTKAKDVVGAQFGKLSGLAKKPISFIINTVYNKGIVGVWNKVAGAFGAPSLSPMKGFARGGVLSGTSSFRQGDDQLVPMRRGEGVYVSEAMRDPYERARLRAVNTAAMSGRSLSAFQGGGYAKGGVVGEGFAKGGIFGWIGSAASKGVDLAKSGVSWLKDGMKASAVAGLNAVARPLIDKISGSASLYKDMITGIPEKMIRTIVGYSGKADSKLNAAGIGGARFTSALAWARTQNGLPYQWAGNGNPSWDCSGFLSAIESKILGQKPHRRWATGAFSGSTAPPGWVRGAASPYRIGITNSGVGHTAGTLNGVNVESRGGDGVIVGNRARGYNSSLFTATYGYKGYAGGTRRAAPGWSWVGEQGPELMHLSGGQTILSNRNSVAAAAQAAAARAAASATAAAVAPAAGGSYAGAGSLDGLTVKVFVGSEELSKLARTEVYKATGELVAIIDAGGGN